jgi:Spy/CpxP family protein refolding chaperone
MASIVRKIGIPGAVLLGSVATFGCGGSSANAPPPATATAASTTAPADDDTASGLMEHHRYHHGGVTRFIAMSLDTLGVSPEQRAAIEKLRDSLRASAEPVRAAEQSLLGKLADGLDAGNVDAASADAAVAQVTAAAAGVQAASAGALNELHAVLTPQERGALVDKVESHWSVWQAANSDETGPSNRDSGRLATVATELALTPDQVDKIRPGLADGTKAVPRLDPAEIAAHLRAFGDAFRGDRFDARALATGGPANAHLVGWGAAHLVHFVETVSPVLTPEQRATFAEQLREHATHNPNAQANP